MPVVLEEEQGVRLAGRLQRRRHVLRLVRRHHEVERAMGQEDRPAELVRMPRRRRGGLGALEPQPPVRLVEETAPVREERAGIRDARHADRAVEELRRVQLRHQRRVAAVAPAVGADARGLGLAPLDRPARRPGQVLLGRAPPGAVARSLQLETVALAAAPVHAQHAPATAHQELELGIEAAPRARPARAADLDEERKGPLRARRPRQVGRQRQPVRGLDLHRQRIRQALGLEVRMLLGQVVQRALRLAPHRVERRVPVALGAHHEAAVRAVPALDPVHASGSGGIDAALPLAPLVLEPVGARVVVDVADAQRHSPLVLHQGAVHVDAGVREAGRREAPLLQIVDVDGEAVPRVALRHVQEGPRPDAEHPQPAALQGHAAELPELVEGPGRAAPVAQEARAAATAVAGAHHAVWIREPALDPRDGALQGLRPAAQHVDAADVGPEELARAGAGEGHENAAGIVGQEAQDLVGLVVEERRLGPVAQLVGLRAVVAHQQQAALVLAVPRHAQHHALVRDPPEPRDAPLPAAEEERAEARLGNGQHAQP